MKLKESILCWGLAFLVLIISLYFVSDILLPFVVAIISAYFLDPAADKLEKLGLSRIIATTIITVTFFIGAMLAVIAIGPLLYDQLSAFVVKIPNYIKLLQDSFLPKFSDLLNKISPNALEKAQSSLGDASGQIISVVTNVLRNVWSSGMVFVNILSLAFITPIVTFYVLRDWDKIIGKVDSWLPKKHAETIRILASRIDTTLAGYIRGQTNVCLFLAVFYSIGLSIVGLEFALFIGIATGILSFIPYVGSLFGFVTSIVLAFFQFDSFYQIAIVAGIFILGQVLEGSVISPKLVGDKVGLHPVWIIFGMLAGGTLFGFSGILLAIPITAIIGVLFKFALSKYLESSLYKSPARKTKKSLAK